MEFTTTDLMHWRRYEKVRQGGRFNMFDPRARQLTGLSRNDYSFVMEHYVELKEAVEKAIPT